MVRLHLISAPIAIAGRRGRRGRRAWTATYTTGLSVLTVVNHVGSLLASAVTTPFVAAVTCLLYIDRRMRVEALDVVLVRTAADRRSQPRLSRTGCRRRCFPAPSNRAPTRHAPGCVEELRAATYHQDPLLDRLWRWVMDRLDEPVRRLGSPQRGADAWSPSWSRCSWRGWCCGCCRGSAASAPCAASAGAVLEDPRVTAAQYRERAATARAAGRYGEAVLDSFRAIARDMGNRTLLDDAPGRTAHEVSVAVATAFPTQRRRAGPRRGPVRLRAVRQRHRGRAGGRGRRRTGHRAGAVPTGGPAPTTPVAAGGAP